MNNTKKVLFHSRPMLSWIVILELFVLFSCFTGPVAPSLNKYDCPSSSDYTNPSFFSDLNKFLSSVAANTLKNDVWFFNNTVGQVYGLAMCHHDVPSAEICTSCLKDAAVNATLMCPNITTTTIWYDDCFIRYSNQNFFSAVSYDRYVIAPAAKESSQEFAVVLAGLMNNLTTQAIKSSKLIAQGESNYTELQYVYGIVECTKDLHALDCQKCLRADLNAMDQCNNSTGCRLYGSSCYLRYEKYPLYGTPVDPDNDAKINGISHKRKSVLTAIIVAASIVFVLLLLIAGALFWIKMRRRRTPSSTFKQGTDFIMFDFQELRDATDNFSNENKLGGGGFGEVFKGRLKSGQEIAVKRMSKTSTQGVDELKNEVELLVMVKHRNLVQVLGCYMGADEKLLCYEYLPNRSLDSFLFATDSEKHVKLDWKTRFNIIEGICRGLVYLHYDSGSAIIHRDLKASNILLDTSMNPKISDFGLARLFEVDQTHISTINVAGTRGYIAPEYLLNFTFSTKSDVYSFGVLILEIVTSRRCLSNLIRDVWKHWINGTILELKDPSLPDTCLEQLTICIHVGLLCVQENPKDRPSIWDVNLMLHSQSASMLPSISIKDPPLTFISDDTTDSDSAGYILNKLNHDYSSLNM